MGRHAIPVVFVVQEDTRMAAVDLVRNALNELGLTQNTFLPNDTSGSEFHLIWRKGPAPDQLEDEGVIITLEGATTQEGTQG